MNPTITIDQLPTYAEISVFIFNEISKGNIQNSLDFKEKIFDLIKQNFNIIDEHMNIESGAGNNIMYGRISWAKSYLIKILNLINETIIGKIKKYSLSEQGQQYSKYFDLDMFKKLVYEYKKNTIPKSKHDDLSNNSKIETITLDNSDYPPLEQFDNFSKNYAIEIKDQLYKKIMELEPVEFEKLIKKFIIRYGV